MPTGDSKIHNKNSVGVLWHKAVAGIKDEDVSCAYAKVLLCPAFRDYKKWVIWVNNSSGQKNVGHYTPY